MVSTGVVPSFTALAEPRPFLRESLLFSLFFRCSPRSKVRSRSPRTHVGFGPNCGYYCYPGGWIPNSLRQPPQANSRTRALVPLERRLPESSNQLACDTSPCCDLKVAPSRASLQERPSVSEASASVLEKF